MSSMPCRSATTMGTGALLMWGVEPLLISEIEGMPLFQTLTVVFISSFLITAIRLTWTKRWHLIAKQPLFVWLIGLVGICGSDFAYFLGANLAPIAHVDLIDYLWPCLVIVFVSLLPGEKFRWRYIVGALLGLAGIGILLSDGSGLSGVSPRYMSGYALALYGAVLWGGYSVFSRKFSSSPSEMVGMYCGVGAVICLILHLCFEHTVLPTMGQASLAMITGVTGAGIAYQLWDHGVKFGHVHMLSMVTYLVRVLAMCLLVTFGKAMLTWPLIISSLLVIFGVFVATIDQSMLYQFTRRFKTNRVLQKA